MALYNLDIIKHGYIYIQTSGMFSKSWSKRYLVLKSRSSDGPQRLCLYPNRPSAYMPDTGTCKIVVIPLLDLLEVIITGPPPASRWGMSSRTNVLGRCTMKIRCVAETTIFSLAKEEELKKWSERIENVSQVDPMDVVRTAISGRRDSIQRPSNCIQCRQQRSSRDSCHSPDLESESHARVPVDFNVRLESAEGETGSLLMTSLKVESVLQISPTEIQLISASSKISDSTLESESSQRSHSRNSAESRLPTGSNRLSQSRQSPIVNTWPIGDLKRYGLKDGLFHMEFGRLCSLGQCVLAFQSWEANQIQSKLNKTTCILHQTDRLFKIRMKATDVPENLNVTPPVTSSVTSPVTPLSNYQRLRLKSASTPELDCPSQHPRTDCEDVNSRRKWLTADNQKKRKPVPLPRLPSESGERKSPSHSCPNTPLSRKQSRDNNEQQSSQAQTGSTSDKLSTPNPGPPAKSSTNISLQNVTTSKLTLSPKRPLPLLPPPPPIHTAVSGGLYHSAQPANGEYKASHGFTDSHNKNGTTQNKQNPSHKFCPEPNKPVDSNRSPRKITDGIASIGTAKVADVGGATVVIGAGGAAERAGGGAAGVTGAGGRVRGAAAATIRGAAGGGAGGRVRGAGEAAGGAAGEGAGGRVRGAGAAAGGAAGEAASVAGAEGGGVRGAGLVRGVVREAGAGAGTEGAAGSSRTPKPLTKMPAASPSWSTGSGSSATSCFFQFPSVTSPNLQSPVPALSQCAPPQPCSNIARPGYTKLVKKDSLSSSHSSTKSRTINTNRQGTHAPTLKHAESSQFPTGNGETGNPSIGRSKSMSPLQQPIPCRKKNAVHLVSLHTTAKTSSQRVPDRVPVSSPGLDKNQYESLNPENR